MKKKKKKTSYKIKFIIFHNDAKFVTITTGSNGML
jgi:hypothetical protein